MEEEEFFGFDVKYVEHLEQVLGGYIIIIQETICGYSKPRRC